MAEVARLLLIAAVLVVSTVIAGSMVAVCLDAIFRGYGD